MESNVAGLSSIHSRLLECSDGAARAHCVLVILAEQVEVEQAFLFGMRAGRLTLLAALPDVPAPDGLQAAAERCFNGEIVRPSLRPVAPEREVADPITAVRVPLAHLIESDATRLYPVLLATRQSGEEVIAGVAALAISDLMFKAPPQELVESLASAFLEHDDVDAATCLV